LKKKKSIEDLPLLYGDITPPPERTHQNGSNITVKDCMTILKETIHVDRATNQKANQIKYHQVSISCLYLIN